MRLLFLLSFLLLIPAAGDLYARQTVRAVSYPDHLVGRQTSSGDVYNPNGLTAAHPSLPFGTMLELVSTETGRSVMVKVNDRGSLLRESELIVSAAAMRHLGLSPEEPGDVTTRRFGSGNASGTKAAGPAPAQAPLQKIASDSQFAVQLGSFSDRRAAEKLAASLDDAWIDSARMGERTIHRVMYGRFRERGEAEGWRARLRRLGVEGYVRTLH